MIDDFINNASKAIPSLKIKYKDQSIFMKILGLLMFFNKAFMTEYITTIGSTIYFPTKSNLNLKPISNSITILHEMMHIYDALKISTLLFSFLYMCPQILVLALIPLLFVSWKIALIFLVFALPIPSYFRMLFEKRGYEVSLYARYNIGKKLNIDPDLQTYKKAYISQFTGSFYYFMWPFSSITKSLDGAVVKIESDNRPFDSDFFDIVDKLIDSI